jgi:putative IMPACT (imprinted ancient) family translation regulator
VRCYREAARAALAEAGSERIFDREEIEVDAGYGQVAAVRRLIDPPDVLLAEERFDDRARFRLAVRKSRVCGIERALKDSRIDFRRRD